MQCPKDCPEKQKTRHWLYNLLDREAVNLGTAITLAGSYPYDLRFLRRLVKPENAWMVDCQSVGLDVAQMLWPGVNVYNGMLLDLIHGIKNVSFVNLDFQGQYLPKHDNTGPEPCAKALKGRLMAGAFIALTYFRGREDLVRGYNDRVLAEGKRGGGKTLKEQRRIGTFRALQSDIGKPLIKLGERDYWHNQSAMTTLVVQVPKGKLNGSKQV